MTIIPSHNFTRLCWMQPCNKQTAMCQTVTTMLAESTVRQIVRYIAKYPPLIHSVVKQAVEANVRWLVFSG